MFPTMTIYEFPATDVRPLRKSLGMTQVEFADELGVTQALVSRWETGHMNPTGPAAKLLQLLKRGVRFSADVESVS